MDLGKAIMISASGMRAQGTRIKVISENIANADSTAETPGELPYRRKLVSFRNVLDRETGTNRVRANKITVDRSNFARRYDPTHPSADADGYVLLPNVNSLLEAQDMREAQRTYEANLTALEASRSMLNRTLDLLRG